MAAPVVSTAQLMCSFGTAPSALVPTPGTVMIENKPASTIMDFSITNVPPFVTCLSLSNPTTASLTAAALGVLTPGPCTPLLTPWKPGSPTVHVGGKPTVNATSTCQCAYGGVVSVAFPGAVTTQVP